MHALNNAIPWLNTERGQRISAIVPLVLGALGGACGAVAVDPVTMPDKIIAGLMVGGTGMVVFKGVMAVFPTKTPADTSISPPDASKESK